MSKLFNANNPFWSFVGKLPDAVVLHLFWLVCSLPVVTFGASTTALYDVMMRITDERGGQCYRRFFRSFRDNLRQGIPMGLFFLLPEAALAYSFWLCGQDMALNPAFSGLRIVTVILGVLIFITFEYAFPLLARFENTVLRTIQNGFFLALRHIGWTLVLTLIPVLFYGVMILFEQYVFPLIILGFGLVAQAQSYILNHVFRPFIEAEEKTPAEDSAGDSEEHESSYPN